MTPAGIEPATFRFVAQHLNHCATAVPSSGTAFLQNITPIRAGDNNFLYGKETKIKVWEQAFLCTTE